jgi:hypothetical protein
MYVLGDGSQSFSDKNTRMIPLVPENKFNIGPSAQEEAFFALSGLKLL